MAFRNSAQIDKNHHKGILATNSIDNTALVLTGLSLTNSQALHVAIVDAAGSQITSFGGGTQYTDGGTPPANPIAPTLVFDKSNVWQHVNLTNGLPVNIVAGGGSGGGPADVGVTTAASETDAGRQKVTSALRLLDTSQAAGSQLVGAKGDQTTGMWVNVKNATLAATQSGTWNIGTLTSITNALPAGTNVIGHVITDTGSTTAVTGTVTISGAVTEATLDAALIAQEATTSGVKGLTAFGAVTTAAPTYTTAKSDALSLTTGGALRSDITTIAGTAPTTAGFIDIKGADGNVFVRQATGTNLHMVVDSGTITAVTAITNALPAGSNVIGHVITDTGSTTAVTGTVTISGAVTEATLDAALIAQEATTSGIKGLTAFGAVTTNAPTYTTAKSDALSLDTSGLLRISLKDTPANTNKFLVTADAITFASPQHVIADASSAVIGHVITDSGSVTNATLSAETTKVIGVTRSADGAGNLLTTNSTTYTSKFALDGNLLGTLGTAFTTAGKVDIKGADGDVFVRQATGTNLHTVVDSGTVTTVSNLSQIASVTPTFGDINNAAAEAGTLDVAPIGRYNATQPTLTDTRYNQFQVSARGELLVSPGVSNFAVQATGGTVDEASFIAGTSTFISTGGVFNDTIAPLLPGQQGALRLTNDRRLKVDVTGQKAPVDLDTIQGENVAVSAPGVQLTSLAGPTGEPIDSVGNSMAVAFSKPQPVLLSNRSLKGDAYLTLTSTTSETTLIPATSTLNDVYGVVAVNSSASATQVDFRDATGGNVRFSLYIPAGDTRGFTHTESAAYKQSQRMNNWTAKCGTSVASVVISALYVMN